MLFRAFVSVLATIIGSTIAFGSRTDSLFSDSINKYTVIADIIIAGNKTTKKHIIMRELVFKSGDTLPANELEQKFIQTKQNLLNTSLFNFVKIDTFETKANSCKVIINLSERWYTWPAPIFELADRNLNIWWEEKRLDRLNYGISVTRENFRGRKESLSFIFQLGFSEKIGLSYKIPYLDKKRNGGIGFSFFYSRNREVAYKSQNNQLIFLKTPDNFIRKEYLGKINYSYRQGIYNTYYIEGRYYNGYIADTVKAVSDDYFFKDNNTLECLAIDAFFRRDKRDSRSYPLKGYYINVNATKVGLGILLQEEIDLLYLKTTYKQFVQLGKKWYYAASLTNKLSSKTKQPYYAQRGLGYGDFVRSYEYYVVDGQHFMLFKSNVKYELFKPRVNSVKKIKLSKFSTFHYALYVNLIGDAGYVWDRLYSAENQLSNQMLLGTGIGIDFVTYYDAVFRFEYSINQLKEHGFFMHFSVPI